MNDGEDDDDECADLSCNNELYNVALLNNGMTSTVKERRKRKQCSDDEKEEKCGFEGKKRIIESMSYDSNRNSDVNSNSSSDNDNISDGESDDGSDDDNELNQMVSDIEKEFFSQ